MGSNPLGVSQRENKGAETFAKYEYQYHWAFCRIIEEQKKQKQYALFMEYHEDVILSSSLDPNFALFEFNQIKNKKSPKYNTQNVTERKNGKNSVLGKLINSCHNKPFYEKIDSINLVASCGFNFSLRGDMNLSIIKIDDLSGESYNKLSESVLNELGCKIPKNLNFIIPELTIDNQQDTIVGKIASMINELYPNSHCDALGLYRNIIDDLHRKGTIPYDYHNWSDVLDKKSVNSENVTKTIPSFITSPSADKVIEDTNEVINELGITGFMQRKSIKNDIRSIHLAAIGMPESRLLNLRKSISKILDEVYDRYDCVKDLISHVNNNLSERTKNMAIDYDLDRYIIYEIVVRK